MRKEREGPLLFYAPFTIYTVIVVDDDVDNPTLAVAACLLMSLSSFISP